MTITKHGKFYSDKREHIDLVGKCETCECEFGSFVDIYWDVPEKGGLTIITDPDCIDMKIQPKFDYYDSECTPGRFVVNRDIAALRTIKGSLNCPDCGRLVALKMGVRRWING